MSDDSVPKFSKEQYGGFDKSGAAQVGTGGIVQAWLAPSKATSSVFNTAYTDYSASFAWTATGTAPALGNAVVVAKYKQAGKFVHYYGKVTFGTTSTYGTGNYRFSIPVTCLTLSINQGTAELFDSSASAMGTGIVKFLTTTTFYIDYAATYLGTQTGVQQTLPWAWATSDYIAWNLLYEAG